MKLYEIPGTIRAALDAMEVDEETGEIINAADLDAVEAEAHEKLEKRSTFLKGLMLQGIDALGATKLKTPMVTISVRTSKAVELDADALDKIPESFVRVKREADKTAIKAAIEGGFEVPGAHLVENRSLTMR